MCWSHFVRAGWTSKFIFSSWKLNDFSFFSCRSPNLISFPMSFRVCGCLKLQNCWDSWNLKRKTAWNENWRRLVGKELWSCPTTFRKILRPEVFISDSFLRRSEIPSCFRSFGRLKIPEFGALSFSVISGELKFWKSDVKMNFQSVRKEFTLMSLLLCIFNFLSDVINWGRLV